MNAHFHLLGSDIFASRIPGDAPSDVDRGKFKLPTLKNGMSERSIRSQVGAVIQSVVKAADCKKLRFIDSATRGAGTKTVNGVGIYRDTAKCKTRKKQVKERTHDSQPFCWMEVSMEVKADEENSAFCFETEAQPSWAESTGRHRTAFGAYDDQKAGDAGHQEGGGQQEEVQGVVEGKENEDEEAKESDVGWNNDSEDDGEDAEDGLGDGDEDLNGTEEDEEIDNEGEDEVEEDERHSAALLVAHIIGQPIPPFVTVSERGAKALSQFIGRQTDVFNCQHRIFCYSVYVCFDMARLLYFDRAGAYVSEPFSWVEPTSLLHEFVWKLAKLANADNLGYMGHDMTATLISPATRRRFLKELKNPELAAHIRAGLKKATEDGCPLYQLTVEHVPPSPDEWFPDEPFPESSTPSSSQSSDDSGPSKLVLSSTPSIHRFIVGRPHYSADTLVGRCTRGYMAFDVTDPKKWVPCFLKDSWRPFAPRRTRPEHLVYQRLNRMNVKDTDGIATLMCGGDVGGPRAQCTRAQKGLPPANRPAPLVHYRLVTKEIGLPLSEFDNFSELSEIFVGALRGHRKAWDLAGVLHRDISVGNIMIRVDQDGKRSGFLIDWDLSRLECELAKGPVEPDRTGTWQFRSALSLRYPRKPYQRSDDIESFIHAYIYLVLRYHPTRVGGLRAKVESLFETMSVIEGIKIGGDAKIMMLRTGELGSEILGNTCLKQLVHAILDECERTYENIDYIEMGRLYGPMRTPAEPSPPTQHGGPPKITSRKKPSVLRPTDRRGSSSVLSGGSLYGKLKEAVARRDAAPRPADLCQIGTFLSDPWGLMKLLAAHAEEAYELDDKAPDQFIARKIQDVFRPSEYAGMSSIGSSSTTGSLSSEHASENGPIGIALARSDMPGFATDSCSNIVGGEPPSESPMLSKKRRHCDDDPAQEAIAGDEEKSLSSAHRNKRIKCIRDTVLRG